MRFCVFYLRSVRQWAVVDLEAGKFIVDLCETEDEARRVAAQEETRRGVPPGESDLLRAHT